MPPFEIERPVAHVAARIAETDRLANLAPDALVGEVTYLYDYLNFAHPFREGNGRTQREFFVQLLGETGRRMAWERIEMEQLHAACHVARTAGDTTPLSLVISTALSAE
jgi:cell filamentation protein